MSDERERDFELIEHYLSGSASADDVKALEGRLGADADLRREFLRYAHVDAALTTVVSPAAQMPRVAKKAKTVIWKSPALRWAAAAVLMLAGALALWRPPGVEVRVMAVSDEAATIWPKDSVQRLREVKLHAGSMQLLLSSGVKLDLTAPVHLSLVDGMQSRLFSGHITVEVGELGKGFVVETSSARVVDLGTRFGVSLHESGETDVAVFKGKVEVFGKKQPQVLAALSTGQAIRVHPSATPRRLHCITTRGGAFTVMSPLPADALVTDITDNVDDGGNYAFYTLQSGQMRPGARPYTTLGKPRWRPMPGQPFPAELAGADIIGTFSPDRHDPDLELQMMVSRPCTVYVMLDARAEVPDWVRRDFAQSGFQLRSGPWGDNPVVHGMTADASGDIYVAYTVWKRTVSSAGLVKLGPPYPEKDGRFRAMYGIAVK